jgi:hypothetical protein
MGVLLYYGLEYYIEFNCELVIDLVMEFYFSIYVKFLNIFPHPSFVCLCIISMMLTTEFMEC